MTDEDPEGQTTEPTWLVRTILVLFFIAFAGFMAREVRNVIEFWP